MNNANITRAAGWLAIAGAVLHLVVTPLLRADVWSGLISGGPWNSVTLEPSTATLPAAEAFWLTPGSFAAPLLLLGGYLVWSVRQGHRVPGVLGWGLIAWGAIDLLLLPASPAWLFPVLGLLVVLGDRRPAPVLSGRS